MRAWRQPCAGDSQKTFLPETVGNDPKSTLVMNLFLHKTGIRFSRPALLALSLFALAGCRGFPNLTGEAPTLTAAEERRARSECGSLAAKFFVDKNAEAKARVSGSGEGKLENGFTAHYNPKRNRCYVDMVTPGSYPLNSVRRLFDAEERTAIVQCMYRSSVAQPDYCWNAEDKSVAPAVAVKAIHVLMEREVFDATERELHLSTPQPAPASTGDTDHSVGGSQTVGGLVPRDGETLEQACQRVYREKTGKEISGKDAADVIRIFNRRQKLLGAFSEELQGTTLTTDEIVKLHNACISRELICD
jgi:hypothetical protein